MRVLITGASGLLGINLALEAAQGRPYFAATERSNHTVFGVTNSHSLATDAFTVVQADLLVPGTLERLLDQIQPDWIIHCAALANVDACESDPDLANKLNVDLPRKLATLVFGTRNVGRGGARLVHISTDAVFDGQRGGYTEEDVPNPLGVYARTKLAGEQAVLDADPQAIVARVNLFGWSLIGRRSLAEFFIYSLKSGKQVKGFTDVYFCPLLANDMAHILLKMLEIGLSGIYHVVSSESITKYDFGVAVARRFGLDEGLITPSSVAQGGLIAARSPNLTLRTDKLSEALGLPIPRISPALERFYTLYQQSYPQVLKKMSGNL